MSDATIIPNGKAAPATGNAQRREAMLPSPCVQNHAANLLALPDGDMLCAGFGGTQEGIADISIYLSRLGAGGDCWSAPQSTALSNNNSSIQAITLANQHLALVFNAMSAADASDRRLSLYDEIEDDDAGGGEAGDDTWSIASAAAGKSAYWGAPRAPMTLAISADGGKSWPWQRNLEEGDGYCMTHNSQHKLNREFSYPSIKQGIHGELHIAFTYHRQAIKSVCVDEQWVTRAGLER